MCLQLGMHLLLGYVMLFTPQAFSLFCSSELNEISYKEVLSPNITFQCKIIYAKGFHFERCLFIACDKKIPTCRVIPGNDRNTVSTNKRSFRSTSRTRNSYCFDSDDDGVLNFIRPNFLTSEMFNTSKEVNTHFSPPITEYLEIIDQNIYFSDKI